MNWPMPMPGAQDDLPGGVSAESLGVAVYATDAEGYLTYYNVAARQLWGWSPPLGQQRWTGAWRLLQPDGTPQPGDASAMATCLREGRPVRGAWAYAEGPDGRRVPVACFPEPLRDAAGRLIGAVNTLIDLTHLPKPGEITAEDPVTGLPNRSGLEAVLATALAAGTEVALLAIGLRQIGAVQAMQGQQAGEAMLRDALRRLQPCLGEGMCLGRLGGDRLGLVLTGGTAAGAQALAGRLLAALRRPEPGRAGIEAGLGIAIAEPGVLAARLLGEAELALLHAQAEGAGRWQRFEPRMAEAMQDRALLEADLAKALGEGELAVHYQPIHRCFADGARQLTGFEALLRWTHPERGPIPPARFIPVAEESGLILPLGAWALRQACHDAAGWPAALKVAVNVSPIQLAGGDLGSMVQEALAASGLDPARLELEITESVLLQQDERVLAQLKALQGLGLRIALDDFGTGYSSLTYLRNLPVDRIKIDRSFVLDAARRPECLAIVEAVAGLARRLGLSATAEGVEGPEHLALVEAAGCAEVQGYHLGRPMPLSMLPALFDGAG